MDKIRAIIKRTGEPVGHMTDISNTLENLQNIVGGYIETVTCPNGVVIICNEEGLMNMLPVNCTVFPRDWSARVTLVGDIIVVGSKGDEFADVPIDLETWKTDYLGMEGD